MKNLGGFIFWIIVVLWFLAWNYYARSTYRVAEETEFFYADTVDLSDFKGDILHANNVQFSSILNKGSTNVQWMIDSSSTLSTLAYKSIANKQVVLDFYHPREEMCNLYYKHRAVRSTYPRDFKQSHWNTLNFKFTFKDKMIISSYNYVSREWGFYFVSVVFYIVYALLIFWFIADKYYKLIWGWLVALYKRITKIWKFPDFDWGMGKLF